ncbi:MAG TPA: mechanosensitive ion channel family protein [Bryobacteraceae bacterium]|nr:mechanosensitive ion channel family protein [Bryobacteraceae bacterium]
MRNRPFTRFLVAANLLLGGLCWAQLGAQGPAGASSPPAPPPDHLGRDTPRGAVLGFLTASRKGDYHTAAQYLNTRLRGDDAAVLARQLSEVLDRRLPARLTEISDRPEGSLYYPNKPNTDLVGTISSEEGNVDITVERVTRGKSAVWLFSKETLDAIPELHEEVNMVSAEKVLPKFLTETTVLLIPLFQWLFVLVGLPLVYALTGLLNRVASAFVGFLWRTIRKNPTLASPQVLPRPIRLLLVVLVIRWMLDHILLPLTARQFWSMLAFILTITALAWLVIDFNAWWEKRMMLRLGPRNLNGSISTLRLVRRTIDLLVVFAAILIALSHIGINVTAALAGLGVGGIAVALAAQKTLENVIGGVSIIFDRAMLVGDFLKIGETQGIVEDIGLRSTRIRTFDRSVVVIPNGQIATVSIEKLSKRDKFWFHPLLSLQYGTTATQMRSVLEGLRAMLAAHRLVDPHSVRVRFLRFGAASLDVEVFAYVLSADFPHFLEVQEELLLKVMDVVDKAGTKIAIPAQTTYVAPSALPKAGVREVEEQVSARV